MEPPDLDYALPAIWLVFGGSYLTHDNAPCLIEDKREQSLVDLLRVYLNKELTKSNADQQYYGSTSIQLASLCELLKIWSEDLNIFYEIRKAGNECDVQARQMARQLLQRIKTFEKYTIIPHGLMKAKHSHDIMKPFSGCHDHINLAILKKKKTSIDWVQVDPGSAYHQRHEDLAGEKSCAYLAITDIDPDEITEDWLYLLVGLKAVSLKGGQYYKAVSLYECLLAHLNGRTVFKSQSDESFIMFSETTPSHTWWVIDQSFRYLLQMFLGSIYHEVYQKLLTGFKFFLMEATFAAYQNKTTMQMEQCHFLLQEMCHDVAVQALNGGDEQQKQYAVKLIDAVKVAIDQRCRQLDLQACQRSKLSEALVLSLSFPAPHLVNHGHNSGMATPSHLSTEPVFVKPTVEEDLIDYLQQVRLGFINKLKNSKKLDEIALLSRGIEMFLIDHLANTDILQLPSFSPFSRDDTQLARTLLELAAIYYDCQCKLVNNFLANDTYQPQFYAKNVTLQFFVYAAVAALNFRDQRIGPLLATHNLSIAINGSLSFDEIVPHLVINDATWLKVVFSVKNFFTRKEGKSSLFSYSKFEGCKITFEITNDADTTDTDVRFAYQLLQLDETAFTKFIHDHRDFEDEKLNRKWQSLAYTELYLPSLYTLLSTVAHFAKVSLTGLSSQSGNPAEVQWEFKNSCHCEYYNTYVNGIYHEKVRYIWRSKVSLQVSSRCDISTNLNSNRFTGYLLQPSILNDSFQRLIIRKGNIGKLENHFSENQIIASQDMKPNTVEHTRYLHLGFLQSNALIKLERLYIAIKDQQIGFSCEQESVLIKQTLFEVSVLLKTDEQWCSLLEWTVLRNPSLIHKLGLLCVETVRVMQYRLTQHDAIGEILEVILGLLTFYPSAYKDKFIEGIVEVFHMLKGVLAKPSSHLSDVSLLHLNAYLIISVQAKPQLLETETYTTLKALVAIQNYKAKGVRLENKLSLRVHSASFTCCLWIEEQLQKEPSLLNQLMSTIIPQWDQANCWHKSNKGLLFTCGDYTIKPLLGGIYFLNQPVMGLPDTITGHKDFTGYLGQVNFTVIPSSREIETHNVPCYLSVEKEPQTRLTLVNYDLIIEEWITGSFQRYIPVRELSNHKEYQYPNFLFHLPNNGKTLTHWLDNNQKILVKDQQRRKIYELKLKNNYLFSLQHQGYVVPWDQLKGSIFKTWLQRVEQHGWIEIIAQQSINSEIHIQSLNFPRLGLHFDLRQGRYYSKQVHGYFLAEKQQINTLHGFLYYLVLIKEEEECTLQPTKIVIPHRRVTPRGYFYSNEALAENGTVQSSTYIVYDLDPKTGLLKSHNIRAQLYLALLYYCSASLDNHDLSNCNAYHLARENLEVSWKDQPFDHLELDIIEQFLSPSVMRDFHSHRIALYLKVISLLSSSLHLAFLYTEESAQRSIVRSNALLSRYQRNLPYLFRLYLQNKSSILARIRLNLEEEEDVLKLCSSYFYGYRQLFLNGQPQVSLCAETKRSYKNSFKELFSKEALNNTSFLHIFHKYLEQFSLLYEPVGVNFTRGINKILLERFRLIHFINLFKLAKSSIISVPKFCYLLHHLVIRSKINYPTFPAPLVMMLARVLLLSAENPAMFPDPPSWFGVGTCSVKLFNRHLTKFMMLSSFPTFSWYPPKKYDSENEEKAARSNAQKADEEENCRMWSNFATHDLDRSGVPLLLPENPNRFSLRYENYLPCTNVEKRNVLRSLYLTAAYNDAMYQFFVNILQKCDGSKCYSSIGRNVTPFIDNPIKITIMAAAKCSPPITDPIHVERKAISAPPLIDFDDFFVENPKKAQHTKFLFEANLTEPNKGYQWQFYHELRDSWTAFHKELEPSYSWLNPQSLNLFKIVLRTEYDKTRKLKEQIWAFISTQLKERPNSKSHKYFALSWYGGQVPFYHKGDIVTLLVEPHKLAIYNPGCLQNQDVIMQKLLQYVCFEIHAAKILRLLALIAQYKQSDSDQEQFSVLQGLVRSLRENLDPASFRYPHWLLFQFENEIIVRDNQRELIIAMLNQTEKAMYQLNMGEGKSSVILPLLSSNLANGQQLLRVNVLPALLITMKEFLRKRFSSLIRKRIYTLPFHRDTNISTHNLTLILQTLKKCTFQQHILLVTPEHRLCFQLKVRELMLENQQQIGATNIFSWKTYRQRAQKIDVYQDLTEKEMEQLLVKQDGRLRTCLLNERYIDSSDRILKVPPRGRGRKEFAKFRDTINDLTFREWSCLKAAYRELLHNSTVAHVDSSEKLVLLNKINALTAVDLLDESDEILRHGTELNYTMGDKHLFDGGEFRWHIPQFFINALFCDLELRNVLMAGKADGFTVCNIHYSPRGGVPLIQLLNESYYEESIKPLLIDMFFLENLPTIRKYSTAADINPLKNYVAGKLTLSEEKKLLAYLGDKGVLKDKLLIAKGWLSHGILFHVFNAKYRVQYGLNLHVHGQIPKPIAIPFTGKDAPSPRSEFSHPDVMLGFTIVSYLYQGLNPKQLKEALLKLRDTYSHEVADSHLRTWTEASRPWIAPQVDSFPPMVLTSLKHLDLSDDQCLDQMHQYLSGNHHAILFYLNQFILIQEGKQYLYKISANAHSLVGYDAALGFSGTDDRKITMPFQIKSLRSTTQEGTNGKLLSVLTQKRNSSYFTTFAEDTNTLLEELCRYIAEHPHCHAIIDAGALVTGLSNYEVASFLLFNLPHKFLGILYFSDEGNSLTVLTRDKRTISLQDCYLDKQYLFAYLDDIHTRGTDIKLPLNCHAVLTVGMGMQKDKLMQAAMRLRQLAQKQSVALWGTRVVTLAIARENSVDSDKINSIEVIKWVTRNTIDHINADLFPVAVRKVNFQFLKKAEAWLKSAPTTLDSLLQHCQEKELFSLEEFYGLSPQRQDLADRLHCLVAGRERLFWQEIDEELQSKQLTCTAFYETSFNQVDKNLFRERLETICKEVALYLQVGFVHSSLEDDQEKEVEVEIIQEREVLVKVEKRDPHVEEKWDAQLVLQQGFINSAMEQNIIMPLSAIQHFIQVPENLQAIIWHPNIYMTKNFIQSVKSKPNEYFDNYLRPVDLLVIHRSLYGARIVLLSGQEASNVKSTCYPERDGILLMVHLRDIDGPTQLPTNSIVSKDEQNLLTVIKLFAGECNYPSSIETFRLAERVGRLYPHFFVDSDIGIAGDCSTKLFGLLIEKGYLDYSGTLTEKLLRVLNEMKSGESPNLDLPSEYKRYFPYLLKKLFGIHAELIVQTSSPLKDSHCILWKWVGTRSRLKEYVGSVLESIINSEYQIKCSP